MPANLDILASYSGQRALSQLEKQLQSINSLTVNAQQLNKIAQTQNQIQIQQTARQNALLRGQLTLSDQEIQNLGQHIALNQQLNYEVNQRLQVATEAATLRRQYADEGIILSFAEARAATMANQQIIISEQQLQQQMAISRRARMQASISLFVLNISANQLVSSLKPLVAGSEEATKMIENFQAALNLAIGPMQFFLALQQIMIALNLTLAETFQLVGSSMLFAFSMMAAMTTKSNALRAVLSILAGVAGVYAAAQFVAAIATFSTSGAIATLEAVLGNPMGLIALAGGIAATTYAVGSVLSAREQAQTQTGHQKRVRKGGWAILDDDEVVHRDSKIGMVGPGPGGINIFLPATWSGSIAEQKQFANMIRMNVAMGMTPVKFKRRG